MARMGVLTDLKILNRIYDWYYDDFTAFSEKRSTRSTKVHVPIDINRIAAGQIAEQWEVAHLAGVSRQLGSVDPSS